MHRKIKYKLDVLGIGTAVGGGLSAAGNVASSIITADATKYAADQAYQGQKSANDANIQMQDSANYANRLIAADTNRTNIQLAREQNEFNLEMWNKQNEYNSPAHQMQLYRDAGMNPNLVAGQFSPAQDLTSADLAVAQQSAPQQAAHVENPAAQSSQILQQGALAQAEFMKNLVSDAVQVAKGIGELKNQNLQNKRTELLMPHEIENMALTNQKLIGEVDKLTRMNPEEQRKILLENRLLVQSIEYQNLRNKSEKSNVRFQKALADAREIETEILRPQIEYLKKMPKAQLVNLLSTAYAAQQKGKLDSFTADYLRKNERMPPNSPWDVLFATIFEKLGFTGNHPSIPKNGVNPKTGITWKNGSIDWSGTLGIFGMPIDWIINQFNTP